MAYRESFHFKDRHFDTFVHFDRNTSLFLPKHRHPGRAAQPLLLMVEDGIALPKENAFSKDLKEEASRLIQKGPAKLSDEEIALSSLHAQ